MPRSPDGRANPPYHTTCALAVPYAAYMARKQRVEAHLTVPPAEAVDLCRRALLDRGAQIEVVTQDHIKARKPGTLIRKYIAYELELTRGPDGGTQVQIAAWTSNLFSTPNDLVGRAARDLQQTISYSGSQSRSE
jgi:hypothetical protein